MNNQKKCFVISPIGEEGSERRKKSDEVLNYIIRKAVEPLGYQAIRGDEHRSPGMITQKIVELISNAEIAIADLTDHNPNVFYELAIRHMFDKPVIQIIHKNQEIPFDVAQTDTIVFDDSIVAGTICIQEIQKQIHSIETGHKPTNPIQSALQIFKLRQVDDPVSDILETLVSEIEDLDYKIDSLSSSMIIAPFTENHLRRLIGEEIKQKLPLAFDYHEPSEVERFITKLRELLDED
jgi:hypothetical protein